VRIHELKTWTDLYPAIESNAKRVEIRFNDRDFEAGDLLLLREYDPKEELHTGRSCWRRVTHVLQGGRFGIESLYVAMSLEVVDPGEFTFMHEDRREIAADSLAERTADAADRGE
jgi:hypothetical protein